LWVGRSGRVWAPLPTGRSGELTTVSVARRASSGFQMPQRSRLIERSRLETGFSSNLTVLCKRQLRYADVHKT
jgi:hypothetical protein